MATAELWGGARFGDASGISISHSVFALFMIVHHAESSSVNFFDQPSTQPFAALPTFPVTGEFSSGRVGRLVAGGTGSANCTVSPSGTEALNLVNPVALATGPGGTFFILDRDCLRVTTSNVLTGTARGGTIAVKATSGGFLNNLEAPQGIYFEKQSAHIYIADTYNHRILRWKPGDPAGTYVVLARSTANVGDLAFPTDVLILKGTLYVLENGNHRVQRFELTTCLADPTSCPGFKVFGCPETCSPGSDAIHLRGPTHFALGPDMDIFVADTFNHRVLRINSVSGNPMSTDLNSAIQADVVAGTSGIPGCKPEQLQYPTGVALDADGFLYVSDTGNHRVQKFAVRAGNRLGMTVAGECCCPRTVDGVPAGGSGLHQLNQPVSVVVDNMTGALLVADRGNRRVLAFGDVGPGKLSPRTFGASCAYGAQCNVRVHNVFRPSPTNQVLIAQRRVSSLGSANATDNATSPCGDFQCTIPALPGLANPKAASGPFLDTFALGIPRGPPDGSSSSFSEYVLCFAQAPSVPCADGGCSGDDNCTNRSAWLCNEVEPFGIRRKVWLGVPGVDVESLRSFPAFPNTPDLVENLQTFETPTSWDDNYGQQLFGLFVAPQTGTYTFHITSDEQSELRISDVFNKTSGRLLAYISGNEVFWQYGFPYYGFASNPDNWNSFRSQNGTAELEAGQMYWLEVLHKEGTGNDFLRVGATLPNGFVLKPLPMSLFVGRECVHDQPTGLGVIHDCRGRTTGQTCTASCRSGFVGENRTFHCDGVGHFRGIDPLCHSANCEEYSIELGSFIMHGVLGTVDCTNMGGTDCTAQLGYWAGSDNCVSLVETNGGSCHDFCESRGRVCVKAMDNKGVCALNVADNAQQTAAQNGCLQQWGDQICVCSQRNSTQDTCLLAPWCNQGLMSSTSQSFGVYQDRAGNLIVLDTWRHVVMQWRDGGVWEHLAGGHGAGNSLEQLNQPCGLFFMPGNPGVVFVADTANHRVVKWSEGALAGEVIFGTGRPGSNSSELRFPVGIFVQQDGELYVVDYGNARVLRVRAGAREGNTILASKALALTSTATDTFFDSVGNYYFVNHGRHKLWACIRTVACKFTSCMDTNATAEYGSACGCTQQSASCSEAHGVLPSATQ